MKKSLYIQIFVKTSVLIFMLMPNIFCASSLARSLAPKVDYTVFKFDETDMTSESTYFIDNENHTNISETSLNSYTGSVYYNFASPLNINSDMYSASTSAFPAPPTIICPPNIVAVNDLGLCTTSILGIAATINDPDGDITTLTWTMTGATIAASPIIGINNILTPFNFNVGITTVTYTVTDAGGSSVSCSFTVTITDTQIPVIACPVQLNATYGEGICNANVVVGTPVTTDNCGIDTVIGTRSDGLALTDIYPAGTTTITWIATDIHGNVSSPCIQAVKVTPGILLVNYDFVGASAYPISPNQTATGITCDATSSETFNMLIIGGTTTGNLSFVNNTVANPAIYMDPSTGTNTRYFQFHISGDSLYKYRKFKLYVQARRGNRAAQTINFAYSTDPFSFTINSFMALISSGTWYEKVVDWSGISLINNRSDLYIRLYASNGTGGAGDGRLFIDNFQVIGVDGPLARPNVASIPENTPVNIPVLVNDSYGCNGPSPSNAISIVSFPSQGTAVLNPDSTFTYTPNANVNGTDSFIYQICDASGSCDTSIVYITITPVSYPPVVSCPGNINTGSDVGLCGAVVNDLSANYFDQDGNIISLIWTMTGANNASSPPTGINNLSSFTFILGISTIQYIVTDADGGSDSCSFTVTVYDSENPFMVCPGDTIFTIPDCATLTDTVTLDPPFIGDNCGIMNIINNAPAQFPEGITSVLWTAFDINGNSSVCEQFVIVNKLAPLTVTAGSTPVNCFGGNDGTATVVASGGTAPYTYLWNTVPAQTTQTAVNLTAGIYTVLVTDADGCSASVSVTVNQPLAPLTLAVITIVDVDCHGSSTGSVTVEGSGGTPVYTYSINGGALQGSGTFLNLAAGTFFITVVDANNCSDSTFVTISEPDSAVSVEIINVDTVACAGQATGSATALAAGGVPPFAYTWNTVPVQNTATATGLSAGTYTVSVTDANGCGPVTAIAIIAELPPVIASAVVSTPILCPGGTTTIILTASGGTAPYTYTFNGITQAGDSVFTGIPAGAYSWSVTDANGCGPATGTLIVTEPAPISALALILLPIPCIGGTATVIIQASGGTAPYTYTFNGVTQVGNGVFTNIPAGLGYVWSVNDTSGCGSVTGTIDITEPPIPSAFALVTSPILCQGGTATVTIIGATGTPPFTFTFNGVTQLGNGVFPGIPAGPGYNWSVMDASGCGPVTGILPVIEPDALIASVIVSTPVACNGDSATVTLQAIGGTAPYTYTFNGVTQVGNGVFTAIPPGTGYTWSVDDTNGCGPVTGTINITEPAVFTASISTLSPVACIGATVVIQAAGGTLPYTYTFNGVTQVGNGVFTAILTGTYIWSADDANGCGPVTGTIDVVGPLNPLIATITSLTDVTCYGQANGSATVLASGGISPYTYSWNTVPVQNTASAVNLSAGNYIATITDSVGCVLPFPVTINEPDSITIAITKVDVACFGDSTGSATAIVSGGTPPYTYLWLTVPNQTTASISNLAAGTYILAVFDSLGCFKPAFVTITQPASALTASVTSQVNDDCTGSGSASVTIAGSGGTTPYQYSLNGGPFQSSGVFNNLSAGIYTVSVRDTNNCLYNGLSVIITGPANPLTAAITSQTNVSCNGQSTGSATVSASGGSSPYTYSWNTVPVQTTATASNLAAGNYIVTITDSAGCILPVNVTITQPNPITISIATVNVACFGDSTGSATALASGGTPPYTYAWLTVPVQTTSTITNLVAGTYTLGVFDSLGCFMPASVTITQPASALTATVTNQVNAACTGGNTGALTVAGSGGTPPYQYSVNGGPYQSSGTFNNLAAGLYNISVRDTNNCLFNSLSVIITGPANPLTATITSQTDVLCNGQSTGSATVAASGGVFPYSYSWNTVPVQNTATASNLAAGNYIVTITDSVGCVLPVNVTINQPDSITVSFTVVNVACFGDSTGSATAVASGGTPPYTYVWQTVPVQTTPTIANLAPGTYTLDVYDSLGCTKPAFVTITQPASALTASITSLVNEDCSGNANGSVTVAGAGGTPGYQYSLDGGAYQVSGTFSGMAAGSYVVTVRDTNNCMVDVPVQIVVSGILVAVDDFYSTPENTPLSGNVMTNDLGLCFPPVFVTANTAPLNGSVVMNADGSFTYTPSLNYTGNDFFTYTITDSNGADSTATVFISVGLFNSPPVTFNEYIFVGYNLPESGNVLLNGDYDPDGTPLTVNTVPVLNPINGTFTIAADGSFTYTPNLNYIGTDMVVVSVCDSGIPLPPACTNDTIFITVLGPNQPPVAINEYIGLCSDATFVGTISNGGTVFNGDTDPENNLPLTVSSILVQGATHGVFVITDTLSGTFNYSPGSGYTGSDMAIVSICDSGIPVGCSNDTVFIEVLPPINANAGFSQMLCNADVTFLVGNSPSPGTGSWAFVSGPNIPNIFPPTGSVAVVTGLIASPLPYVFGYTISNGGCLSTDTMSVINYNPPTPSYAGIDQKFCSATGNVTTTLQANTPVFGTGMWIQLAGPNTANILDPNNPNTTVTNLTFGAYVFQWLISNGVCQSTADVVFIFVSEPAIVDAGNNSTICEGSTHSLSTASALNYSSLLWTSSGTGTFSDPTILNPIYSPSFTDITNGLVVLTLTATANDPCPDVSDQLTLIITLSPSVFAGDDVTICTKSSYTVQDATAENTAAYNWTTSGIGTLTGNTTLNPTYTPAPGETGDVMLFLNGIANAPCSNISDTMVISIVTGTTAYAGPDTTICGSESYTLTGTSATNYQSLEWVTSGTGSFDNTAVLNPVYTPSPNDINDGFVFLTLTATGSISCADASDQMKLMIVRQPLADAGPDASICQTSAFIVTQATAQNYNTITWTTNGIGTLTGENTLTPVYTPATGESGTIILTLIVTGNGACAPATDQLFLFIQPATSVNAGPDLSTCESSPVSVSGSSVQNGNAILWTSSGNGSFSDPSIINPVYTPGTMDVAAGIVMLTISAGGMSPCPDVSDQAILAINKAPLAAAGPDVTTCVGVSYTINQASASNYSSIQWDVSPASAGTMSNPETLSPTFTPASGFTGVVTLTIMVQGTGTCGDIIVSDVMSVYINSTLIADAGPDQTIWAGSATVLTGTVSGGSGFYAWYWQPANLLVNSSVENPVTLSLNSATTFIVTVMDLTSGCMDNDTMQVLIGSGENSILAIADYDTTLVNVPVTLNVLANDINPDGIPLTVSLCGYPSYGIVVLNSDKTITYTPYNDYEGDDLFCYKICSVIQPALCADTMVYIHVKRPSLDDLFVYTGISPNGDGNNDTWKVRGIEKYPDNTVFIFNRWGDKVREFANYNNTTRSWNGTNENGDMLPDGTYFYILNVENVGVLKGWIFLRGDK